MGDNEQSQKQYQDYEINFMHLFLIIWNRKWIVIGGLLISLSLGSIAAYMKKEIFQVKVVLEPGVIELTADGKVISLDSIENIKNKIESYSDAKIKAALGLNGEAKLNAEIPKGMNSLNVSLEMDKANKEYGPKILDSLIKELQEDYNLIIEREKIKIFKKSKLLKNDIFELNVQKEDLKTDINKIMNENQYLIGEIVSQREVITLLREREKSLMKDILNAHENSKRLVLEREFFLKEYSNNNKQDFNIILNTTTIQQNISLSNEMQNNLENIQMKIGEAKRNIRNIESIIGNNKLENERIGLGKIKKIEAQVAFKNQELQDMEESISYIKNVKMRSNPTITVKSLESERKKTVITYGMLGFLFSIVWVIILEVLTNNKEIARRAGKVFDNSPL